MAKEKNEAVVEQTENAVPKGNEIVEIFIPRSDANKDPNLFVAVNGVSYLLPRGKTSKVPAAVAEEIRRAWAAEDAMYESKAKLKEAAGLPGEG